MVADTRDFEERYSACFKDFALKIAAGAIIGSMAGGFFLRGYGRWPTALGGGVGFGAAYINCERSLNSYLVGQDQKACRIKKRP
ncbi:hypothetical protein JYU34_004918 [Plutella xylostella]|uniref:MICOS complex subunit MIC10 n=1 Tax=Plutella xylostella TaxID=51655 RepID=A0ABQ7QVG9_PLUXY|nr:hypothetical protein JYU34_004918 [Plutella xylostella]